MNDRPARFQVSLACLLLGLSVLPGVSALSGCKGGASTATGIEGLSLDERQSQARQFAMQAQAAEKDRNSLRAIELYQQAGRSYDGLPYVWNNLGVLLLKEQRHLEAVEAFQRASQLSPQDPRPLENIGIAYHQRGWDQRALEYFNRALETQPRSLTALRGSIQASRRLNVADEATLERARLGLMLESDPAWVQVFQREVFRIEYQIKNAKASASTAQSNPGSSPRPGKRSESEQEEPTMVDVPVEPQNSPSTDEGPR